MTLSHPEQTTQQPRACDQSPDYGTDYDLGDAPVGVRGERAWEEPIGVWGGKTYEELYVEHAPAARRLALSMVPHDVADDIVAEAFARVLAVIRAGGGPSHAFQGYLLTAVRNQATDWLKTRRRLTVVADMDVAVSDQAMAGRGRVTPGITSAAETQAHARDEARLIARAFGRLPARWRAVLWQLEVEDKAPAAVAPMFGLSANGVSALAMRAREGLRQAYLEEHIGTNIPAECRPYAAEFGAGARGRLSQRRRAAVQAHLGHCLRCQDLFTELTELNSRLGEILTPVALAGAGTAMGTARHAAMIRVGLTGPWRTWRLHPVTTAAGAAAGVAVAGGMLFAVNVTPVTGSPSHIAARPAAPSAVTSASPAHRRGQNTGGPGSGQPGSLAGTGSLASVAASGRASGTVAVGTGSAASGAALTASTVASGATSGATHVAQPTSSGETTASPSGHPAATVTTNASVSTPGNLTQAVASAAGDTVSSLTSTVSSLTGTAGNTVSDLTATAGSTVSGLTSTVGGTVSDLTSTAGSTVSDLTNTVSGTAGSAVSDVARTVASSAGTAVSGAASSAGTAVSGAASSTETAVSGAASTAGTAVSGAATAANTGGAISSSADGTAAATTSAGSAAGATSGVSSAVTGAASTVTGAAGTAAAGSETGSMVGTTVSSLNAL
jgi:RNA polymerase sigma factor (sigma-70 family)